MKIFYQTRTEIQIGGKPRNEWLGIGITKDDRQIFGLILDGHMSMMAYELGQYFIPKKVLESIKDGEHDYFIFHLGDTPESSIKISYDKLEKAFKELGLVE